MLRLNWGLHGKIWINYATQQIFSMCIASSKFSTEAAKELRSRREQPLAMLVDNI